MGQIVINNLDDKVLEHLRMKAALHGLSLAAEVRAILSAAVAAAPGAHRPLASLVGAVQSGRTQAEIDAYVRGLRDEWER